MFNSGSPGAAQDQSLPQSTALPDEAGNEKRFPVHPSLSAEARGQDPRATLYNPCLLPGSGWAAAVQAGEKGGCAGAARESTARAPLGSCRVSACAGVSLVQGVCHSLPSWGTQGLSSLPDPL